MTRLLVDTSAYSLFMQGSKRAKQTMQSADEIYLNPVVLGELRAGFRQGRSESRNLRVLEEFISSPRVGLLPIDEETAERYAVIYAGLRERGTPAPANDLWIAATAMQYGLKVLTADQHYKKIREIIIDYHEPDQA